MMETVYYHILDLDIVGKEEGFVPYLYDKEKGWQPDKDNVLMDRVTGYDTSESKDSSYGIGNTDIMSLALEITEDQARKLINEL
jgi:hypothetical protein|nr:MAG TPA: BssS protein family protein [Caudoviricetes sp.]